MNQWFGSHHIPLTLIAKLFLHQVDKAFGLATPNGLQSAARLSCAFGAWQGLWHMQARTENPKECLSANQTVTSGSNAEEEPV
jgi:hypothetical protein